MWWIMLETLGGEEDLAVIGFRGSQEVGMIQEGMIDGRATTMSGNCELPMLFFSHEITLQLAPGQSCAFWNLMMKWSYMPLYIVYATPSC